jgi:NADP-dependent 3-hydroxy acid dehydrogenase YdfG
MQLEGSSAIVTGASSGIGRSVAARLADRGVKVFACGRRVDRLASLADLHDGIVPVEVDVRREEDRARLVDTAGPVDLLVNTAGVAYLGMVEEMADGQLEKLLETNCLGYFDLARRVVPGMLERRRGHVVDVGSCSVWIPGPPLTAYAATKAAVHAFNLGLRRETMGRGVQVSVVAPGPVSTEITSTSERGTVGPFLGVFDALAGQPEAVADAVVELLQRPGWALPPVRSVPRRVGLLRVLEVPGVDRLTDVGITVWREVLRRAGSPTPAP